MITPNQGGNIQPTQRTTFTLPEPAKCDLQSNNHDLQHVAHTLETAPKIEKEMSHYGQEGVAQIRNHTQPRGEYGQMETVEAPMPILALAVEAPMPRDRWA